MSALQVVRTVTLDNESSLERRVWVPIAGSSRPALIRADAAISPFEDDQRLAILDTKDDPAFDVDHRSLNTRVSTRAVR